MQIIKKYYIKQRLELTLVFEKQLPHLLMCNPKCNYIIKYFLIRVNNFIKISSQKYNIFLKLIKYLNNHFVINVLFFYCGKKRHNMAGLNFLNSDPMFCPKSTQLIEPGFKIVMLKLLSFSNNLS